MGKVAVPRWALATLSAALGVSLLAVAFLLGRESRAPAVAAEPVAARREHAGPPERQRPAPVVTSTVGSPRSNDGAPRATPGAAEPPESPPTTSTVVASVPPTGVPPAATGNAVCDYFAQLERIPGARASGPSDEVAQRLVAAVLDGDSAGLDQLLADADGADQVLRRLSPPPECAEYHRRLVALLGESRALLAELKDALTARDADRLTRLSGRALAMQQRADDLQTREKTLKLGCSHAAT